MSRYVVSALYKFVTLPNYQALQAPLLNQMKQLNIRGTLLLAAEGINGTISGTADAIEALYKWLAAFDGLDNISHKESYHERSPFHRTKVKLKKEIVTLGVEGVDPNHIVGTYVKPSEWNALIQSEDVTLVDTRNDYEFAIGTFEGAINPKTDTFRQFPDYVKNNLDPKKHKKVAMFCTGGIRCEKSTAYLKGLGFDEVYHLEGGILKYLEEVPEEASMWKGECFVFDDRVAVNHALEKGQYDQCHACRFPITEADKQKPSYQQGISCHHCHDTLTDAQKARYREREKQNQLAKSRGEAHIGGDVLAVIEARRQQKQRRRHSV